MSAPDKDMTAKDVTDEMRASCQTLRAAFGTGAFEVSAVWHAEALVNGQPMRGIVLAHVDDGSELVVLTTGDVVVGRDVLVPARELADALAQYLIAERAA